MAAARTAHLADAFRASTALYGGALREKVTLTPLDRLWSLDGRVAIVTGAARGFGAAIARRLSEAGATVVIADMRHDEAEGAAARIARETGLAVHGLPVDIRGD